MDVNGDGIIDDYDMVKVGNTIPHWTGGINTDFTWKDFSLYVRMDYALDYKLHDFSSSWIMGNLQGTFNTLEKTKDSWTPENPNAKYPTYVWADQLGKGNYQRRSTMFTHEGSYLAFREVALTYTVPQKLISKWNIQKLAFTCPMGNGITHLDHIVIIDYTIAIDIFKFRISRLDRQGGCNYTPFAVNLYFCTETNSKEKRRNDPN